MNKMEYLERLESCLKWKIPKAEVDDIMRDYAEYFEEGRRQSKTDFEISAKLGNPEIVAEQIIEESRQQKGDRDYRKTMKKERKEREEKELGDELKQVKGWFSRFISFLKKGFCSIGRGVIKACRFFLMIGLVFAGCMAAVVLIAALLTVIAFGGAGLLFAVVLLILSGFAFFWISAWTGIAAVASSAAAGSISGLLIAFGLIQWKKLWAFLKKLAVYALDWFMGTKWAAASDLQNQQSDEDRPKGKQRRNIPEQEPQAGSSEESGCDRQWEPAETNCGPDADDRKEEEWIAPMLTLQKGPEPEESSKQEITIAPAQTEPEAEEDGSQKDSPQEPQAEQKGQQQADVPTQSNGLNIAGNSEAEGMPLQPKKEDEDHA